MSDAPYFSEDSFRFLRDIARNNERAWFQQHRDEVGKSGAAAPN